MELVKNEDGDDLQKRKTMKKAFKEHSILIIGIILSVLLLVFFVVLQSRDSSILKLDSRWILISGVPILIGLIVGGYIKSFKGFGIELEARLNDPITAIELKATSAIMELPGDEKKSSEYIQNLSTAQLRNTKRLGFILGRRGYYTPQVVAVYLKKLTNLEYLEVKKRSGEFVCLIPVNVLKDPDECFDFALNDHVHAQINKFIRSLERENILQQYSDVCINLIVEKDESLIEVLAKMRSSNKRVAVILDERDWFLGAIVSEDIERRIADNVLYSRKKK